jgi:hypothetical protein
MSTSERRTGRKHHSPRRNYPLLSWYALFFLLCFLLLPIPTYAQEPGPTTWEWRTFTAANSPLAPGGVWQLLEGSQGRMWVRTSCGVSVRRPGDRPYAFLRYAGPPTPTPALPPTQTPAPTSTPRIVEVERVVPGLPREAVLPLVGGLGGLSVVVLLGAMIRSRVRRAHALRRGFNPYEAGRPILDPHRFFGREALIAQVLNTIHQNDVLIHGERRIGKTSLLRQLEHRLRAMDDPDYQFIPVYADVEGVPQAEFFHLLMEEIVVTYRKAGHTPPALGFTGKAAADYTYRDFLRDLQSLLEVPQAARHRTIRLILLLDEVDVMNGYDQLVQQQFRRILMKRFAQQVGVVAGGVHVFREWSREESPFRNLFVEIHLGTMEEEPARRLITEPVKGIYSYDDEAVDLILRYSEHKPWRIQRLCLEVVNRLLAERRTRATRQDVEEVHRRMLSEEAEWAVPQGHYPALAAASLPAAEEKVEYRAKPEGDRDA